MASKQQCENDYMTKEEVELQEFFDDLKNTKMSSESFEKLILGHVKNDDLKSRLLNKVLLKESKHKSEQMKELKEQNEELKEQKEVLEEQKKELEKKIIAINAAKSNRNDEGKENGAKFSKTEKQGKPDYICEICAHDNKIVGGKIFPNEKKLNEHLISKHSHGLKNKRPYKCPRCHGKSKNFIELIKHAAKKHHKCEICGKIETDKRNLNLHYASEHFYNEIAQEIPPRYRSYNCPRENCKYKAPKKGKRKLNLVRHLGVRHNLINKCLQNAKATQQIAGHSEPIPSTSNSQNLADADDELNEDSKNTSTELDEEANKKTRNRCPSEYNSDEDDEDVVNFVVEKILEKAKRKGKNKNGGNKYKYLVKRQGYKQPQWVSMEKLSHLEYGIEMVEFEKKILRRPKKEDGNQENNRNLQNVPIIEKLTLGESKKSNSMSSMQTQCAVSSTSNDNTEPEVSRTNHETPQVC